MKSSAPEALLFDDLPNALGDKLAPEPVFEALLDCKAAYPALLLEMRRALGRALGVDPVTFEGIAERGAVTKNPTNDFNFDAFADRAAGLETEDGDIEGLLSILLHRPDRKSTRMNSSN